MHFIAPQVIGNHLFLELISTRSPFTIYRTVDLTNHEFVFFTNFKSLHPDKVTDGPAKRELAREGEILKSLHHKNINRFVEHAYFHDHPYLTYEYAWGKSLLQILRHLRANNKMLSEAYTTLIGAELCKALEFAHQCRTSTFPGGILHKDLNPRNIVITFSGEVLLLGFGRKPPTINRANLHDYDFRSLVYLSPEQMHGEQYTIASETFTLGSILYEMVTGTPPFMELSAAKVANRIGKGTFESPETLNSLLSEPFSAMLNKALSFYSEDRFTTAAELGNSLHAHLKSNYSAYSSIKLGKLMRSLFNKDIVTEIKHFQKQLESLDLPQAAMLRSIPKKLFQTIKVADGLSTGEVHRVPELRGFTFESSQEEFAHQDTANPSMGSADLHSSSRSVPPTPPDNLFLHSRKQILTMQSGDFFEEEDSSLIDFSESRTDPGASSHGTSETERSLYRAIGAVDSMQRALGANVPTQPQMDPALQQDAHLPTTKELEQLRSTEVADAPFVNVSLPGLEQSRKTEDTLIGKLLGEYEVEGVIGWGGMGTVYQGHHTGSHKAVAIKVLKPVFSEDPQILRRFIKEAKAASQLTHPNIIEVLDFGQVDDRYHYIVMERLAGKTLAEHMSEVGIIPIQDAYDILLQLFSAVHKAHESGVIHRDLKPDNIFLVRRGAIKNLVKVLDFGIAKFSDVGKETFLTKSGIPIGTPLYMSPEQCQGLKVGRASDIYSLGVLMYKMFSGRLPFMKNSYLSMLHAHMQEEPLPPSTYAPINAELEDIILWCLEKNQNQRPRTVEELKNEVIPVIKPLL